LLFTISGKHITITEAIRQHAEQKTSKLPRFYNSINQVGVVIDGNKGGIASVEIIARGERSKVFIDVAVRKLERQLRRTKQKERDNKRAGGVE